MDPDKEDGNVKYFSDDQVTAFCRMLKMDSIRALGVDPAIIDIEDPSEGKYVPHQIPQSAFANPSTLVAEFIRLHPPKPPGAPGIDQPGPSVQVKQNGPTSQFEPNELMKKGFDKWLKHQRVGLELLLPPPPLPPASSAEEMNKAEVTDIMARSASSLFGMNIPLYDENSVIYSNKALLDQDQAPIHEPRYQGGIDEEDVDRQRAVVMHLLEYLTISRRNGEKKEICEYRENEGANDTGNNRTLNGDNETVEADEVDRADTSTDNAFAGLRSGFLRSSGTD